MALIGFARVSTSDQDLTSQLKRLEDAGCTKVFSGKHSSKEDTNKAALTELLGYVREGDTVLVTKIDRFGRSLSQVLQAVDSLSIKGVNLKALDQDIDTSKQDPMSRAMFQLLGMFAEMERNFIIQRTWEGKQTSGNYGGRKPSLTPEQVIRVRQQLGAGISQSELAREYRVSRMTIMRVAKPSQ